MFSSKKGTRGQPPERSAGAPVGATAPAFRAECASLAPTRRNVERLAWRPPLTSRRQPLRSHFCLARRSSFLHASSRGHSGAGRKEAVDEYGPSTPSTPHEPGGGA